MSVCVSFDSGSPIEFSSTKGWGDVLRWFEKGATDSALQLGAHGICENLGELADGLDQMLDECDPSPDVRDVVKALLDLLGQHKKAEFIIINNGVTF